MTSDEHRQEAEATLAQAREMEPMLAAINVLIALTHATLALVARAAE